jgi:glycosyltransferase involved in cell wall biosynthesis
MKISVIICTHNPQINFLNQTLDSLKNQTLPKQDWELLIIDNASTKPLSEYLDISWHSQSKLIQEEEAGLTNARICGINNAIGDLIILVDDDNVLCPDYLEVAIQIQKKHPSMGCFGPATILPEFEEEPSEKLRKYTPLLALRDQRQDIWSNKPDDNCVPWGAGLCIVSSVAKRHIEIITNRNRSFVLDRIGCQLLSGGDTEFSYTACNMGYGKGVFKNLKVRHLINSKRVKKDYLIRISEGHGYSNTILDAIYGKPIRINKPSIWRFIYALSLCNLRVCLNEIRLWKRRFELSISGRFIERAWDRGSERAARDYLLFINQTKK